MELEFEWDPDKALGNLRKHGVEFEEAASAFDDPRSLEIPDPDHSEDEVRFVLLGRSEGDRLLVVVHTERDDKIRIISSRPATWRERLIYEGS